jgi:hypothetical protein
MFRRYHLSFAVILSATAAASTARADDPPKAASEEAKAQARARYTEGVKLVQRAQWSDALAAFESAAKLYPNPATTLNMGACERALGRYVRARATLSRALEESAASASPLPESSVTEAKGFIAEIDRVLARASLTVDPPEAAIAIDGRPLAPQPGSGPNPTLAAGVLPPGPGAPPPAATFDVILDPGVHVITLSRKGFTDAVVNRTFSPGSTSTLELKLDLLPATLKVTSSLPGALVRVDDADVGPTPTDVLRPAGSYRVIVQKKGFLPYTTQLTVKPGEEVKLRATLLEDKPSIVKQWWFWTGIGVVVAGGAVLTYALTRPTPPPDGGSLNWVAKPTAVRW